MKFSTRGIYRLGALVSLLLVLTGCASSGSSSDSRPYEPFRSKLALEDRIIVARVFAPVSEIDPGENTTLVTAPFLGTSPLELSDTNKLSPMLQLARRVSTLASVRHNGDKSKDLFSYANGRVRGLRITHRLLYRSWDDLYSEFPLVDKQHLVQYAHATEKGVSLAKWSVEYYFDVSKDGSAYRIILTGAHFIDHRKPESNDQDSDHAKPVDDYGAFFGAVTYRYPARAKANLVTMSILFKLFQNADGFIFTGGEQSSGWLPLQPGTRGPYNLYLSVVHATNFLTLLDETGGFDGFIRWLIGIRKS